MSSPFAWTMCRNIAIFLELFSNFDDFLEKSWNILYSIISLKNYFATCKERLTKLVSTIMVFHLLILRTWVWEKMVPRHELLENIPLHSQGLNCGTAEQLFVSWRIMLGKRDGTWTGQQSLGLQKNSSVKYSQSFARKHLNQIHVSLWPVTPPWGSKAKHHWDNRKSKCQAITFYKSCVGLSNGKQNVTCTSHYRVMGIWLYKPGWQRLKWKDPRTSNVETQIQVDADGMGVKEGIGLRWLQGFGLDELDG